MYTIIWQEDGQDKWDRFRTKEEVRVKLKEINELPNASPLGDIWIFHPQADEYASEGSQWKITE